MGHQAGRAHPINTYADPEGVWQTGGWAAADARLASYTDRRLIQEATFLQGAVYHIYNDDGKLVGITQGRPIGTPLEQFQAKVDQLSVVSQFDGENGVRYEVKSNSNQSNTFLF